MLRLANVGRGLLMAAWIDAVNAWQSGIHARGLVIGGAGTFVFGLLMFEGLERWDRRHRADSSGPPPPRGPRPDTAVHGGPSARRPGPDPADGGAPRSVPDRGPG